MSALEPPPPALDHTPRDRVGAPGLDPVVGAVTPDQAQQVCISDEKASVEPPVWKENFLVLIGLFPTVMLFTLLVAPRLKWTGEAAAMLLGNVVTVGLLGWPILGSLRRWMRWWLEPEPERARTTDWLGALLLVGVLAAMTAALQGLAVLIET